MMIKFFGKIRYSLMSENPPAGRAGKTGKYLKYAIGEILLVMIGILLALQVNNWNELRVAKIKSYNYLQRLSEDMVIMLNDIENSIKNTERNLINSILVKNALENKELSMSDQKHFERYLYTYHQYNISITNSSTYNEMISSGELNLITSQWIRDAFSKLLDQRDFLLEVNQSNHNLQILKSDEFYKHVRYDIKNGELVSNSITPIYDFDALAADESFINMISRQSLSWKGILWQFKSYNSDVLQIRDSINAELQKLNNR